jgi:hypothetical protein
MPTKSQTSAITPQEKSESAITKPQICFNAPNPALGQTNEISAKENLGKNPNAYHSYSGSGQTGNSKSIDTNMQYSKKDF